MDITVHDRFICSYTSHSMHTIPATSNWVQGRVEGAEHNSETLRLRVCIMYTATLGEPPRLSLVLR